MDSDTLFDDDTTAALLENQRQRVVVSRRLLAAHKAGDVDAMDAAQSELTALYAQAVDIQCKAGAAMLGVA